MFGNKNRIGLIIYSIVSTFTCCTNVNCTRKETMEQSGMVQLLESTAKTDFYVPSNVYASTTRIAYFDSLMQVATGEARHRFSFLKAESLLYGNQNREAILAFEQLLQIKNKNRFIDGLEPYEEDRIESLLALSYLRLGEQENCLLHHTSASCIIPIRQQGLHHLKEGSQKAIKLYEKILTNNGHDLSSRWLLNVAYMTLGKYPQEVPQRWLIPEKAFESDYPLKSFPEIAASLGLDVNGLAGGCVIDDFNNDGNLDILQTNWFAGKPMHFFVNQGNGTFTDKSQEAGLTSITGGLNMVQADYNNDGFVDVLILRGAWLEKLGKHPNSLLRNNGDGTFTDVTIEAGVLSFHPTQTAVWKDFNNDGWLDLFIGNESSSPQNIHPCELYLNQQNGTFVEVAAKAGISVSSNKDQFYYIKGVTAADYDKDGLQDVYISALDKEKSNLLMRNTGINAAGIPQFVDVSAKAGLGENISSFPCWFWDYNNDGWLDLFVAGFDKSVPWGSITKDIAAEYLGLPHRAETARLYQNNGDGTFTNVSAETGLDKIAYAMGANFGDLDNDGFLDMYLATGEVNFASIIPNRVFRNSAGKTFQDVTTAGGFGHLQKGHAVSFADLDNDGDQDIHVVLGGAYEGDVFQNALFQNPYQQENNWITIQMSGKQSNTSAIGAELQLSIEENGKQRYIFREVNSGGSFGCSPLRMQIGVGKAKQIDRLEIKWPASGKVQQLENIQVNQFIRIREGESRFSRQLFKPINFSLHELTHKDAH